MFTGTHGWPLPQVTSPVAGFMHRSLQRQGQFPLQNAGLEIGAFATMND